jgi:hypothetical protein
VGLRRNGVDLSRTVGAAAVPRSVPRGVLSPLRTHFLRAELWSEYHHVHHTQPAVPARAPRHVSRHLRRCGKTRRAACRTGGSVVHVNPPIVALVHTFLPVYIGVPVSGGLFLPQRHLYQRLFSCRRHRGAAAHLLRVRRSGYSRVSFSTSPQLLLLRR